MLIGSSSLSLQNSTLQTANETNLPPGPKPWPIIGNLNLVGSIPHQSLHFLSQKYGELMQLKFGTLPVVVASSPEMPKQFLRVHDTTFASRPALSAVNTLATITQT
ncbi:cytochrome [Sesamum angolense]|uniref:Cytochrome n=1 Tax=Sesamum angolense TaxID=2727404 RepID=A0AAE1T8C6_9LAMI|nr:cytochrome [Sesamum angolense]